MVIALVGVLKATHSEGAAALSALGLLIHLWKTKTKKYTGKIRQKSGLYKIEHLQDIQKGKFVEVKNIYIGLYVRNCIH